MTSMKLYTFWRSSASYRVRIILNLKSLNYESVPIHFRKDGGQHRKPDFLAKNSQGLLPVLQEDGWHLSQSMAIAEYLEEVYPAPSLFPDNPREKAEVREMAQVIACEIHPLNNLRVMAYLSDEMGQSDEEVKTWYRHWVDTSFAPLETKLASRQSLYCFGDKVTLADVCLVPQVYNALRFNVDMSQYPSIERISNLLESLPAFFNAAPEQQADAV